VFDSVMDAKKPSTSTSRKLIRKDRYIEDSLVSTSASRSSSQNKSSKEKSSRSPLRATTLESNVKKSNRVEFREPLASHRDTYNSLFYHSSSQLEAKQLLSSLDFSGAEGKTEVTGHTIHDQEERDLHSRDFESPCSSAADETVVRYLNDRPAIDALQNNEAFLKVAISSRLEEEKTSGSRGDESSTKTPQSNMSQDSELKVSSPSVTSTSSAHRLEILKRQQHDAKLEKLKERIRKQWEHSEELGGRGQHSGYAEQPVMITNVENAVTPKVRKVAPAPAAPSYRGFNPPETNIRTLDGKIWREEEFHISRELYRDIALQLTEDSTVKGKPTERNKEKKAPRPVRKVQKLTRLSSPESKQGGNYVISTSSWREGQKLVKKILGPAPRTEQDRRAVSSDRTGRERAVKSGCIGRTGSDSRLDVTCKTSSRSSERSRSKVRSENNLKKLQVALPADNQEDHASVNKDFLPVEIRGILDDLQLDSMSTKQEKDVETQNQKSILPTQNARSHSPTKRKPDKTAASEEPQVISKKRHYDTDEVRQYIIRQQEERKKKQNEEKKAQKEATEQKNKRLQELYRKQKEALTKVKNVPPPEPSAAKRLQETYSKLLLEHTFLEELPELPTVQETQPRPGYQPSGESDKENKAQERPPSASSSSDMSLSEPQQPLLRSDLTEPPWVQPDRLSPRVQLSHPQALMGSSGGPCSQHWSFEKMNLLSKECDAMLAGRRSHAAPVGSLVFMPQPYLNSPAAQQNLLVKPTANQYKSKLDRIEALKATAASLSSRIESEAKKLAGAGINYGTMWNSDHEFMQENQDDGRWAKAVSPPVREENEDAFSAKIQKMLGTCVSHTAFDDSLPGVGNLSEFKKLPETIRPHTAAVSLGRRSPAANRHEGIRGHFFKRQTDSPGHENQAYAPNKAAVPQESSIDSISEGPLLSDGSLSEEEGAQHKQLQMKMLETLKEKDFCIRERNAFEPIKEFQKEAEKYLPLFTQTSGTHSKGPWEELAKGSPHSVINIFTKSYQLHGKGKNGKNSHVNFYFLNLATPYTLYFASKECAFGCLRHESSMKVDLSKSYPAGCMRFSPAGLQHRLSAELNYLSAIEESVRQLSDIERVRGISLAQQESVSLAQILKVIEKYFLILRNKTLVHAESLQHLVQSRQEAVREAPLAAAKQAETMLLTTDTAHQIHEMTELARTQISDTVSAPAAPVTTLFDHQRQHHSEFMKQLRARTDTNRKCESAAMSQGREETGDSKQTYSPMFDSYSESSRSKVHDQSSTSSRQESPSVLSSKENEKKLFCREKITSSVEEQAHTGVDDSLRSDSILSLPDEKDSASVATEYSLKFDESMTEDEIEEKSFRSLLPSESHRRNNLEKKRGSRDDSDEEVSPEKTALSSIKELSMPFSGGQDSFSKFTMEMVRQYMKEEEMRAAHQSSLLRLREKALKEKTKAELAWLEHQKKHLRDKGEDDKMPPIRKRQRGLLLRLQQEKAEIKRLQEANKAARKERQLILKQQAEIERIRQTTIKLQEKLKSAGENKLELHSEDDIKQSSGSSPLPTDAETRSPSPISISSSETSSIMQKLKKMRSRMDEKFLTKREQKLMQRRQHAEELLEWKRRLDAEEAEIRRIEKQALAAWEKELLKTKIARKDLGDQRTEPKETASEEESPVPPCSYLNSESSIPEDLGSLAAESVPSETMGHGQPESPDQSTTNEEMVYSEEFKSSTSPGKLSPPKSSISVSKQDSSKGSHRTGGQLRSPVKSHQISHNWSDESLSVTQSETTSDQSDIEGRIRALKDELRKRKSVVYQLKKEQKKRQKERLKAQEASLIKQLESYDEFIKKTEAELSQDLEASPTAKPQIKTPSSAAAEKPKIKAPPLHRPETIINWKSLAESERSRMKILKTDLSFRAGAGDPLDNVSSSSLLKDVKDTFEKISCGSVNSVGKVSNDVAAFSHKSEIQEDLEYIKSEEYETDVSHVKPLESSDVLLTLDKEQESSLDILPKKVLRSENKHSQKELFGLSVESLHGTEEILEQRLADKDAVTGPSVEDLSCQLSKSAEEKGCLHSEQLFSQKELSYLEDFEGSSSRKQASVEETLPGECHKDDFEASLLSPNRDSQSLTARSQHTQTSRSRSTSLGSDGEISEYLSDRSLSLSGSMHSERLLELKSPTELIKNTERRDVEQEQAPTESLLWASVSIMEETDSLPNFNIGDRVLVSKVQPGTLRFKGLTKFAKGFWAGVELDKPEGNNNGTYDSIKYFDCKEKHGIFAPPQKISHITESIDSCLDTNKDEDSFFDDRLEKQHKAERKDRGKDDESQSRDATENYSQDKAPANTAVSEASDEERVDEESSSKVSTVQLDDISDLLSEKLERQKTLGEECAEKLGDLSTGVVEKPATPLLDLLTKEKKQLEAQLRLPLREEEKSKDQLEKVSLLTDSLLRDFVKDTVNQLQQIKKIRNEKIQLSNQELCDVKDESSTPSHQVEKQIPDGLNNFFLSSDLEDEREELSSPDMCPRPESPVFGASGQEELAKRLAELELNREFLSVLGDDQDWFDEDYGLSSRKVQQKQAEEPAVLPKVELQKVPTKPSEEPLAVPHTAVEVESMVHAAAEELWKLKELGHDLQSFSLHTDLSKALTFTSFIVKVVFDLTREIFGEIFAEDPNLNQPIWMKPCRIASAYFRRVKDPNDLAEIKSFIAAEVLKLFSLRKEPNHKTDWQKMMKFGRKKRDRVDHILVQELHEEEAQWVNYDEDELCVKMQLADGIFEALIRDTVDVLNQINEKQQRLLLV
uniref:Centrosomal protein 350 n=1 Tax=Athene cunicularia TaxID=194338 RepID=A0A663M078_ATHCN